MPPGVGRPAATLPASASGSSLRFMACWALVGQAVPLYTDWLWFKEVGFTQVFTTRLAAAAAGSSSGSGAVVFVFLFVNLSVAARTAPPDVLWELEDQLGLPGRAILEPLVRRLLLPVIAVIALFAGARGPARRGTPC